MSKPPMSKAPLGKAPTNKPPMSKPPMRKPPSVRAYRMLLSMMPGSFRRRRGAEMERLFLDMSAELAARGVRGRIVFWTHLLWDTVSVALRERANRPTRPLPGNRSAALPAAAPSQQGPRMLSLLDDVRHALRCLVRQPRHGFLIILLITISVAGNAAVFPLFNGFLLRPLPFDEPEQLVDIDETAPQWNLEFVYIAWPDFLAWRRDNKSFENMAVYQVQGANYGGGGDPRRVDVVTASSELTDVLRLQPLLGRAFSAADNHPDAAPVTMLAESFWRREFGGDAGVIGRTVRVDARPYEIVGVLPRDAAYLADVALWLPQQRADDENSGFSMKGVGRLLPGVSIDTARADLLRIHRSRVEERDVNAITSPVINRFADRYLGDYRAISTLLLGAVVIILMIACANIAGLMLAQSLSREPEIAMRLALGARRSRIVRQLFVESLVLAMVGGLAGVALGVWGFTTLVAGRADQLPAWVTFDLDARFFAFTLLVTGGAAVAFGLWPAVRGARGRADGVLRAAGSRLAGSRRARRAMNGLVVAEVGMAVLLLIAAGIALADLRQLERVDPGYQAEGLISYKVQLRGERFAEDDDYRAFINEHVARLRALPGVVSAAMTSHLPLTSEWGWFFVVEGAPPRGKDDPNPVVQNKVVTPGYLETMGIELLAGRTFEENDGVGEREPVIVVNESFARHFFPGGADPIGQRVGGGGEEDWKTIIGVTRDVRHRGMTIDTRPGVYQPMSQFWTSTAYFVARTAGDPYGLLAPARELLREMDSTLPMYEETSVADRLRDNLWTRREASWLMVAFSTVALLLAATGLYGMISYSVRQRVHEFGIRLALGAEKRGLVSKTLGQGMVLAATGAAIGVGGAWATRGLLSTVLVRAAPVNAGVYAIVLAVVALVALLANLLPALRAASTEPVRALRDG